MLLHVIFKLVMSDFQHDKHNLSTNRNSPRVVMYTTISEMVGEGGNRGFHDHSQIYH